MYTEISKAVRLDSDTRLVLCGLSDFVRFSIIILDIYIYMCVYTAQRVLLVSRKLLYELVATQFRFLYC